MMLNGLLLTCLSFRPRESQEQDWKWMERFGKSKTSRIVGPIILSISCIGILIMMLCSQKRKTLANDNVEEGMHTDEKGLLYKADDIASFTGSIK